ncbi:MAG TPA: ATP-dependent zinc metalloprotease FtsH [Clostridia bacterium]|nr:ATP-dependent zinc metalloprotease FtsH [Clostridia bacterium]
MKKFFTGPGFYIIVIALVFLVGSLVRSSTNESKKEINYTEFKDKLSAGVVKKIYVDERVLYGIYTTDSVVTQDNEFPKKYDFRTIIFNYDILMADIESIIEESGVPEPEIKAAPTPNSLWPYLLPVLGTVIMVAFLYFFLLNQSQSGGKALMFGKTNARLSVNDKHRKTFEDVAGADEEKEELIQIVDFLKNPKKYLDLGARIPKGVLLVGPPGTGKTLLAKAVAGEAGVPFFTVSGSDFVEMFVGVGASRVRDLFQQAKKNSPCIVFIDEIDAVGRQRGAGLGGGHDEREQTLNQLLVEMDGFSVNEGIIVMAATNRVDVLDPALLRPGRFDRQVVVHIPDIKGREDIFAVHAKNKPVDESVDPKTVARLTTGFTGADMENMLNEAALLAAKNNKKKISMSDISEAIKKVLIGPEKKSRVVTQKDKRITAYHEAGHALVARTLPNFDPVQEISIVPRGLAAGYTLTLPEEELDHMTRNKMLDMIAMMLAGRAAEEMFIGDISTGAHDDLKKATSISRKMVTEFGMSDEIGLVYLGADHEVFVGRDFAVQKSYSESLASKIDDNIKKILDNAYARAREILNGNRELIHEIVGKLIENEKLSKEEFEELYQKYNPQPPKEDKPE